MEKTKKRSEIDLQDTWRLEDIFETERHWESALTELDGLAGSLLSLRGHVADGSDTLADSLEREDLLSRRIMSCYAYARMRKDQDNAEPRYQAMFERASAAYHRLSAEVAFLAPEISKIPDATLRQWIGQEPRLAVFRHHLDNLMRQKPHILPEREERLLAMAGPVVEGVSDTFDMLDHVDLKYGTIEDENGQAVELTGGRFSRFRESPDRRVREDAFRKMHESFAGMGNTIATLYAASVKGDLFFSRARGYDTALSSALFSDRLEKSVYTGLIDAVREAMPAMERYLSLRKRVMGIEKLHIFDCYVPIVEAPSREFTFAEACSLVRDGVSVLGHEYGENLDRLFGERWIDRYENEGKSGGAYAWGTYDSHPYMLINFSGGLPDVLTLAHEAGHCMHTLFSCRRPHVDASYPTFLAEIASTVNEILLIRRMMDACDLTTPEGRAERAFYVNRLIEEFRLTVFRQTMFAEFEMMAHERAEAGEPLTAESLCGLYADLLRVYFGPEVEIDDYMRWEWARIPHFYNAYYVFKYATGFSAAAAFCDRMDKEGAPAVERYLGFLGAGGSDYPLEILREAGLDMADGGPVRTGLAQFEALVTELASLLDITAGQNPGSEA